MSQPNKARALKHFPDAYCVKIEDGTGFVVWRGFDQPAIGMGKTAQAAWKSVTATRMNLKLCTPTPPPGLLTALERARLNYSTAKTLFYLVWCADQLYCGVFGDGENGGYEWFIWDAGKLEHSDCGYGGTEAALRDVLNKAVPE